LCEVFERRAEEKGLLVSPRLRPKTSADTPPAQISW
jgi:hypothetical protein